MAVGAADGLTMVTPKIQTEASYPSTFNAAEPAQKIA